MRGMIIEDGQGRFRALQGAPVSGVAERTSQDPANGMMGLDENGEGRMPVVNTGGAAIAPPASSFAMQSSR